MFSLYRINQISVTTPASPMCQLIAERNTMNRKKKLNDAYNKKLKKMNDKLRVINKPKYISKADREKIALAESQTQEQYHLMTNFTSQVYLI